MKYFYLKSDECADKIVEITEHLNQNLGDDADGTKDVTEEDS